MVVYSKNLVMLYKMAKIKTKTMQAIVFGKEAEFLQNTEQYLSRVIRIVKYMLAVHAICWIGHKKGNALLPYNPLNIAGSPASIMDVKITIVSTAAIPKMFKNKYLAKERLREPKYERLTGYSQNPGQFIDSGVLLN